MGNVENFGKLFVYIPLLDFLRNHAILVLDHRKTIRRGTRTMNEAKNRRRHPALRLYNILFPVWLFYLLPTGVWLLILPANFAIDSLVLHLAMKRQAVAHPQEVWKRSIIRVWLIGFLGDLLGATLILGIELFLDAAQLHWNTFLFPGATLVAIPGVALAAFLIYRLDKRFAFAKCELEEPQIQKLSLTLATFTAPYAMLVPLYG